MTMGIWNEERIAALGKYFREDLTYPQIATRMTAEFGVEFSKNTVTSKIHRLGWVAGSKVPPQKTGAQAPIKPKVVQTAKSHIKAGEWASRGDLPVPQGDRTGDAVKPLLDAPEAGCMWPIGEPGEAGFCYCGRPRAGKRVSYCEEHIQASAQPSSYTRRVHRAISGVALKAADGRR